MLNTLSPTEQMAMAGRLNEARRQDNEEQAEEPGNEMSNPEERSLREAKMASLAEEEKKKSKLKKVKEKASVFSHKVTGTGLRWAWESLIPSWGLTIIYINIHAFLRWVFPSAFCKLGDEWVPKKVVGENSAANIAGTAFGIVEIMGLLLIDVLLFFIILAFASLLCWLTDSLAGKAIMALYKAAASVANVLK